VLDDVLVRDDEALRTDDHAGAEAERVAARDAEHAGLALGEHVDDARRDSLRDVGDRASAGQWHLGVCGWRHRRAASYVPLLSATT